MRLVPATIPALPSISGPRRRGPPPRSSHRWRRWVTDSTRQRVRKSRSPACPRGKRRTPSNNRLRRPRPRRVKEKGDHSFRTLSLSPAARFQPPKKNNWAHGHPRTGVTWRRRAWQDWNRYAPPRRSLRSSSKSIPKTRKRSGPRRTNWPRPWMTWKPFAQLSGMPTMKRTAWQRRGSELQCGQWNPAERERPHPRSMWPRPVRS